MKKSIKIIAVVTLIAVSFILTFSTIMSSVADNTAHAREILNDEWNVYDSLDYGLYFYGADSDQPIKAGEANCPYDPTKPTIIYSHGWKIDEGYYKREVLSVMMPDKYSTDPDTDYFAEMLLDEYNVASFFWNQISDEDSWDSVVKVWTKDDPTYGMRYRLGDKSKTALDDPTNPKVSVAQLFINELKTYMDDFSGETLWLVGHSMGSELTLAVAEGLSKLNTEGKLENAALVPDRLSLMDPFFSSDRITGYVDTHDAYYKNVEVCTLCANAMKNCADAGMAIEVYATNILAYLNYSTSNILSEAKQEQYAKLFSENAVWYFLDQFKVGAVDIGFNSETHVRTRDIFFVTVWDDEETYANDGKVVCSVTTDIDTVKSMMGRAYYQKSVIKANKKNAAAFISNSNFVLCDGESHLKGTATAVEIEPAAYAAPATKAQLVDMTEYNYDAGPSDGTDTIGEKKNNALPMVLIIVGVMIVAGGVAGVISAKKKKA